MRSSESQHVEIQTEESEADGSRRLLFSLQCTRSATGREQSGNHRPGSCSHQQTVYCKKVAGSKGKHQPETESMQSKIQYLLRKPGTWKTEVRNSHSVLSERARAQINLSSSAQLSSPVVPCGRSYLLLPPEGPWKTQHLWLSPPTQCYSGFSAAPSLVSAASVAYARYLSKQDSLLFSLSK